MKLASTLAIVLATALTATAAHAEWTSRDEIQAPRSQAVQAPRDHIDEATDRLVPASAIERIPRGELAEGLARTLAGLLDQPGEIGFAGIEA